ncbi:MAG: radical SAM protein [Bacteroidota bacterium]
MKIYYSDSLNFISKLTIYRVWNAIKILSSYYISRYTKKAVQWGMPFTISIEPTTNCNLGCPECPSGLKIFSRNTGNISIELYEQMIHQLHSNLLYLYFYFQGEPYLHPQFLALVRLAKSKNIYTVTSTNAHFLTARKAKETVESGLDRIIISIDGTTQEVYENYRKGGSLEKVIEGTKQLVHYKKTLKSSTPHIIIQFLVVKPNEHQIDSIYVLANTLGVDEVKLKTAQVYEYAQGNELIPSIEKYSRYKKNKSGIYQLKNKLLNHCWKLWHSSVITWDGLVVPCCFDKDATHTLGDLKITPFHEIWHNHQYMNFRTSILKARSEIDICTNCTEGTQVWVDN